MKSPRPPHTIFATEFKRHCLALMDEVQQSGEMAAPPSTDHVIIATARQEGMTVVTADRAILDWALATGAVRTMAAR